VRRVIVLTSNGLDSILTLKIMEKEGLDVVGIRFVTWFNRKKYTELDDLPYEYTTMGISVLNIDISNEYLDILLHPEHGYGSAANPCIDCKIFFLRKARKLLKSLNADFVATGEVIGQRPMSQRPDIMRLIGKESGLKDYLLRPLSAKLLEETIPEKLGWVNRDNLYDISGRSRIRQINLARQFNIKNYLTPAGGCILTEKNFNNRFKELLEHKDNVNIDDLITLRYGRHFRISKYCKLIVGRHEKENDFLKKIKWGNVKIDIVNTPGPFSIMEWDRDDFNLQMALEIIARYADYQGVVDRIEFKIYCKKERESIIYKAIPDVSVINRMIIR